MARWSLRYHHKSALLVVCLFLMSLLLPAFRHNLALIPGIRKTNVTWGIAAFLDSLLAVFLLSPVGLTHLALLVGVIAQFYQRWRIAAIFGILAFLLGATTFRFYDPNALPNDSWNHMTGTDHSGTRITELLSGFYCWWSCGFVLAGAALLGLGRYRQKDQESDRLIEGTSKPNEVRRIQYRRAILLGLVSTAVVFIFWEYRRFSPRRSEQVLLYYPRMTFRSPEGDSQFNHVLINPPGWVPPEHRHLARRELPDLFIRLDGETVLFVPDLTREVVEKHFRPLHLESPLDGEPPERARGNPDMASADADEKRNSFQSEVFTRAYQQSSVAELYYREHQGLKFRFGSEIGEVSDPGLEIGSRSEGPYYTFPLSRKQIVELFGTPTNVETVPN